MKTITRYGKKNYLTFGWLFLGFLGFSQTITTTPTNPIICGEDNIVTVNLVGESKFSWSSSTPVDAYINSETTILYTNQ